MDRKLCAALLALGMSTAAMTAPALGATSARAPLSDLVAALGGDPAHAQAARYAYLRKLDSHIQELVAGQGASAAAPTAPRVGGLKVTPGNRVLVDVYVNGDVADAARQLRALGMHVNAVGRRTPERTVEGYLPLDAITKVAALQATKAVMPVTGEVTDTGAVLSQGDASQNGPQGRALGPTGAGVTVGVISDSMNQVAPGVAGSRLHGDLPANVTILNDDPGGEDEGRAMAEIVYDEAPGITRMLFDTGSGGPATKAAHIAELVANGASVIADDISELGEPFFQDGQVAQAVDAAKAAGTAYVASAGNRARQSWEGPFVLGAGGDNDFGGGDVEQTIVTVPAHATLFGVLQWDEPWGAASTDLDALLFLNGSLFPAGSGESDNIASGIPSESFGVTAGGSPIVVSLRINRFAGTSTPKMKYILFDNFGAFTIAEHDTSSPAINPDAAAAKGSLAAAAVCWSTNAANCSGSFGLQMPENFSSRGPLVRTRSASGAPLANPDVRPKPNVAGADGVSTDLALGSGLNPFFGTSAATPSVAGVAALARSANPRLTVDQLYALLTDPANALDCTSTPGVPDTDCGAGFIQADRVLAPATIGRTVSPAAPDGANGWYRSPVSVSWQVTDPHPYALSTVGCGPTTVTADTTTTLTCIAGSGNTRTSSLTIKHDSSAPTGITFSGIAAKAYKLNKVPRKSRIHCSATDPTSGVTGCTFTGYSSRQGAHRLRATATNGAGLTSTKSLSYKVGCVVPKLKGKTLAKAKSALKKAHCSLGKVKGRGPGKRVVKSSSPAAGKSPRKGSKVNLTLRRR